MRMSKNTRHSMKYTRHKRTRSNKSNKKLRKNKSAKNTRRKRRSLSVYKKGGGCGCGASSSSGFFMGGTGNVPTTNGLDAIGGDKIPPLNNFKHDPSYMQVDENATGGFIQGSANPTGGKKKISHRHPKIIKGGDTDNTRAVISGIQNTLPAMLPGASEFSNGGNFVANQITPVQFSPYSYINPMPSS